MSIIRKHYVDVPGGQVHYRQLNLVGGVPLVLLHQTASSGVMFESLMELLGNAFHTLAPDTPGFGASYVPQGAFNIQDLAASLHTALVSMGMDSCYLFGHHTGAAIAVQMAYDFPGFVRKMVLSGPPWLDEAQIQSLKASLKPFALSPDGSHLTQVWERIRNRDLSLPLETVHREVLLTQLARQAAQQAYQAVFEQPFKQQAASLDIPVLVMAGENDTLRASLEPAYAALKKGAIKIIPNQGPYLCDQAPGVVAQIIHEFFV